MLAFLALGVILVTSFFISWKVYALTRNKHRNLQIVLTGLTFLFVFAALFAVTGFIVISQIEFSR